jgi:hypothetical protein
MTTSLAITGARVEQHGFSIHRHVVPHESIRSLNEEIDAVDAGDAVRARRGRTYAVRNALDVLPTAHRMAQTCAIQNLAARYLPGAPRITRVILFDKNPEANWKVPWHQDVTLAVRERVDAPGFGPWSVKAGVVHVQPPAEVLASMITLRIALDDCDATNGPLLVLPGTHDAGLLDDAAIRRARETIEPVACTCEAGDIVVMRPLILHASTPAHNPRRRRILHLEFAGEELPGGLRWRTE